MRAGERLVLMCGKGIPDFSKDKLSTDAFPLIDKVFNFKEWRKEECYKKIVKPEEDHDLMNNKRCYFMNPDFDIIVLQETDGDEEIKADVKAAIGPNLKTCFDILVVT